MRLYYRTNFGYTIFVSVIFLILFSSHSRSQIKVFERPSGRDSANSGLFIESETRKRIELNGPWEVSFNEGVNFSKFIIPVAYNHEGRVLLKRSFSVTDELLKDYSFIFVAEGINYESEVKINNNFISNHTGGNLPVIIPLTEGIISTENEIKVTVSNSLNFRNTIPLSDQINYSEVFGGIVQDIYILAVPKLFVLKNKLDYKIDNLLTIKLKNTADIKSSNLYAHDDSSKVKEYFIQTKIFRKTGNAESGSSSSVKFTIGDNNSMKIENDVQISNPVIWTPETPELYLIKTIITDSKEKVIDEFITETGFTNLDIRNNQIFQSGKQFTLNGINYYEDQPKFASALDYKVTENDLKNIKTLGFNAVRVPGKISHPYIVNICNRLGLYLFQEIPFNETSEYYLEDDKYIRLNLGLLSELIERDKSSPCILAWGIGNDFDVSKQSSLEYVKAAGALIDSLDFRFRYYTSRAYAEDICSEEVDFVGINFYENNTEYIKNTVTEITNRSKPVTNRKNPNIFVSGYGISIQNSNTNGFSDSRSQEAQMKFFSETFPKISQLMFGNFISSYADWNSSNPLNHPEDTDQYLKTNGLYTFNREQKRSAEYIRRLLNKEDLPRIQEGNFIKDYPYIFIFIGMFAIVIFLYFINRDKKFRSGIIRCLYKPTYFYSLVKDQMIITTGYNLLLSFSISIGIALYFSSLLYFYKDSNTFDMILAKILTNDSSKITFSGIINNKLYLFGILAALNLLITFFTALFLYFISFYTKGKSYFKNIYTVCVWSTLPMIIFLFLGTIFYKLTESNPGFVNVSIWLFVILYILYLNRIIIGAKSLFDIRTGKVYLYGLIIIFVIFALIYSYFRFFTGALETYDLISVLNK
ncbi:MAG: hypothetical protein IPL16_02540 [Ignavibacteria bacterium]|nr:hypothetical protein [Ignavibacteria bacterium]